MNAEETNRRLNRLEAERLILTIEIRCELLRAAKDLLPAAIEQAKGKVGKKGQHTPGSPALLRLITRLAMRPAQIDRPTKNRK
jgi:hypothetical protein